MKDAGKIALGLASVLILNASARADSLASGAPYTTIATRNVFGLMPTPTVVTDSPPVVTPPVKITPNGITDIFGYLEVLYKTTGGPGAKEQTYLLTEGQQKDGITVVRINESAGLITFDNHGIEQDIPLPNASPSGSGETSFSMHNVPRPGALGSGIPPYFGNDDGTTGQAAQIPKTKEQQVLMIEALRAYYKSQNDPRASTLPPTALTPPDAYAPADGTPPAIPNPRPASPSSSQY